MDTISLYPDDFSTFDNSKSLAIIGNSDIFDEGTSFCDQTHFSSFDLNTINTFPTENIIIQTMIEVNDNVSEMGDEDQQQLLTNYNFSQNESNFLAAISIAHAKKDNKEVKRLLNIYKTDTTIFIPSETMKQNQLNYIESILHAHHGYVVRNSSKNKNSNYNLPNIIGKQKNSIVRKLRHAREQFEEGEVLPKKRGRRAKVADADGYFSD